MKKQKKQCLAPIWHKTGSRAPDVPPTFSVVSGALTLPGLRLQDADLVAERVAQAAVDPVAVVGRLLRELDALGAEPLVRAEAAVGAEGVSPNVTRKVRMKC